MPNHKDTKEDRLTILRAKHNGLVMGAAENARMLFGRSVTSEDIDREVRRNPDIEKIRKEIQDIEDSMRITFL